MIKPGSMNKYRPLCYSFGGATFRPDDTGNFLSVDQWDAVNITEAFSRIKRSFGETIYVELNHECSNEQITIGATIIDAGLCAGRSDGIYTISVHAEINFGQIGGDTDSSGNLIE